MKASEMDKGLEVANPSDEDQPYYILPEHVPAYNAFRKIGQSYERNTGDRVWDWWVRLVTAEPVKDQEIKQVISQIYRITDQATGSEYLFYNEDRRGVDWKNNPLDMALLEGIADNIPMFRYDIDPTNGKVISGSTQVLEVTKQYTVPFKKAKIDELSKFFRNPLSCVVVGGDGRKYSCSFDEFRDIPYNELIKEKTGINEYFRNKRGNKVNS